MKMNSEGTLLLTYKDIAALMRFSDYVAALEEAFRLYAQGNVQLPGLVHIDAQDGAFHIKAAGLPLRKTYVAVKVNGNFPQNMSRFSLPTIQGAITLCDGRTGYPLAFLDSIEITRQRTGAATALACKYLARPDSAVATICGCGRQGRIQLVGLKHVLPLERAYAFDVREETAEAFAREMTTHLSIPVIPVTALSDGVRQSDEEEIRVF
jgi:ornithine cyclodeaminase/alanine dehydrogenase